MNPLMWLYRPAVMFMAALTLAGAARAAELELPHVRASYDGIDEAHARAPAP